jgi:hypothetical protein
LRPVATEQGSFPSLPRLPCGEVGQVWLLVEQDAVGLELRDRKQQLVAPGWK